MDKYSNFFISNSFFPLSHGSAKAWKDKIPIKKNFSKEHYILFGVNTLDPVTGGIFNSLVIVNNNMEIAKTEIFGPVLSVMPFKTEEEAISIANDTPYGLTNYIQTQDPEKVKRVARKLRSGMVDVNGAGIAVDAPFGGFKHSGIGREAGEHGLEEFLEVKAVGGWSN